MTHWSFSNDRLGDILDHTERYGPHGSDYWQEYLGSVARMSPQQRAEEEVAWDRKLEAETGVTRETAGLIAKRRELRALCELLKSAGR